MGAFALKGEYLGPVAPDHDIYLPPVYPHRSHDIHGSNADKIICGVNEGIYILNNQQNVTNLFTIGLRNCCQVILRNATASFTTHIFGGARFPIKFLTGACRRFKISYGAITSCHVVPGLDQSGVQNQIASWIGPHLGLNADIRQRSNGYTINIQTGQVSQVPNEWNPHRADVGGTLTAQPLIDRRIIGPESVGEASCGDLDSLCSLCRDKYDG